MRFGFVTCVQLGLSCMEAIYAAGGRLAMAMSLQDDMARAKSGRVYLDEFCAARNLDLIKVRNVNAADSLAALQAYDLDWLFIIGWSQIARDAVLGTPKRGVIGMHPTLLPQGRGRAAIPWAIIKGLDATGVTMFQLDAGVDTGPIIAQIEIPLAPDIEAGQLYRLVDEAHVRLMRDVFPQLNAGSLEPRVQDERYATEWAGRLPQDGRLLTDGPVAAAERLVRATTRPYPGAFVELPEGRATIWRAHLASADEPRDTGWFRGAPVIAFADGALVADEWEWRSEDT